MLTRRTHPEAQRRAINEDPADVDQNPAAIDQQRVIVQQRPNQRNAFQPVHGELRQTHNARAGERTLHTKDRPQQEHRQTTREQVQRHTNDEFVTLKLDHKQPIEQPQQNTRQNGKYQPHSPAGAEITTFLAPASM